MQFQEGNRFWELRSSHGRELIFSSPEILWDAAKEYFEATINRPWIKKDWVGKDGYEVTREVIPPFTLQSLYLFLEISPQTWSNYRERPDFMEIITRIEGVIYSQKFEGASVGAYNANIIARDLGLADKQELTRTKIVVKPKNAND